MFNELTLAPNSRFADVAEEFRFIRVSSLNMFVEVTCRIKKGFNFTIVTQMHKKIELKLEGKSQDKLGNA